LLNKPSSWEAAEPAECRRRLAAGRRAAPTNPASAAHPQSRVACSRQSPRRHLNGSPRRRLAAPRSLFDALGAGGLDRRAPLVRGALGGDYRSPSPRRLAVFGGSSRMGAPATSGQRVLGTKTSQVHASRLEHRRVSLQLGSCLAVGPGQTDLAIKSRTDCALIAR
jgi:hypothetical protein